MSLAARQRIFVRAEDVQLLLHGNAYLQVLQNAEGLPAELFALRPERVTVEAVAPDLYRVVARHGFAEVLVRVPQGQLAAAQSLGGVLHGRDVWRRAREQPPARHRRR